MVLLSEGSTLTATVVIPARYASSRFPAKIIASQTGKPLVQHVVEQVLRCRHVRQVIVAADDQRIVEALAGFGTRVVMTRADHPSGTDRIAEVAAGIEDEIIVNVQGDEPEIEPEVVDQLIERIIESGSPMATAATPFARREDVPNPNLVKVILNQRGQAIYFSRLPIPYDRDAAGVGLYEYLLHLGLYAYRRNFLLEYAAWAPTLLEQAEKLEQLRAVEHGVPIEVLKVHRSSHGVDTPEQYAEFVARYKKQSASGRCC